MSDAPAAKKHAPRGRIKADPMDASDHKDGFIPCTATAKGSRLRCKRRPIPGGTVCVKHGGGAPQVQAKAEERLKALIDPALIALSELIAQREFPSVRIAAVKDVLDRNGALGKARETQAVVISGKLTLEELVAASLLP